MGDFVKSSTKQITDNRKHFSTIQEGVRICVEMCAIWRYKILYSASELWKVSSIQFIVRASVIIQNRIVKTRWQTYNGDGSGRWSAMFDIHEDE